MISGTALPAALRAHERRFGRPIRDVLLEEYSEWSAEDLAAEFGVADKTMRRYLRVLGIERRSVLMPRVDHDEHPAEAPETPEENHDGPGRDSAENEVAATGAERG